MKLKYRGTIAELKSLVKSVGIRGNWKPGGAGKYTFRSPEGGILNWWTTGTVNFQGKDYGLSILERSLTKYFAATPISDDYDFDEAEDFEPDVQHHQVQSGVSGDSLTLLLRIKEALTAHPDAVKKINDTTYVVHESSGNLNCYLLQEHMEALLRE